MWRVCLLLAWLSVCVPRSELSWGDVGASGWHSEGGVCWAVATEIHYISEKPVSLSLIDLPDTGTERQAGQGRHDAASHWYLNTAETKWRLGTHTANQSLVLMVHGGRILSGCMLLILLHCQDCFGLYTDYLFWLTSCCLLFNVSVLLNVLVSQL